MWQVRLVVDFNGIVLFDPEVVSNHFNPLRRGTNLFKRFTTTEAGDEALAAGLFVPVLAIDDSTYDIYLRFDDEPSRIDSQLVLCESGPFALRTAGSLVVANLGALQYWNGIGDGNRLQWFKGFFLVRVRGFSSADLSTAGYEFVFTRTRKLARGSRTEGARMRVLRLDEPRVLKPECLQDDELPVKPNPIGT